MDRKRARTIGHIKIQENEEMLQSIVVLYRVAQKVSHNQFVKKSN